MHDVTSLSGKALQQEHVSRGAPRLLLTKLYALLQEFPMFHTMDGRKVIENLEEFDDAREVRAQPQPGFSAEFALLVPVAQTFSGKEVKLCHLW